MSIKRLFFFFPMIYLKNKQNNEQQQKKCLYRTHTHSENEIIKYYSTQFK